jgi:hypothetical protein
LIELTYISWSKFEHRLSSTKPAELLQGMIPAMADPNFTGEFSIYMTRLFGGQIEERKHVMREKSSHADTASILPMVLKANPHNGNLFPLYYYYSVVVGFYQTDEIAEKHCPPVGSSADGTHSVPVKTQRGVNESASPRQEITRLTAS